MRQHKHKDLIKAWDELTEESRGIQFGEVTCIGAGVKVGKSKLVSFIGTHDELKCTGGKLNTNWPEAE